MNCGNIGCPYHSVDHDKNCTITVDTAECYNFKPEAERSTDSALISALKAVYKGEGNCDNKIMKSLIAEAARRLKELSDMEKRIKTFICDKEGNCNVS